MTHARHYLSLLILAFVLAGCQSLGLEAPQSFGESLAYAYSQNAAVRSSAAQALTTGAITKADATQVLTTTDTARSALDEARKLGCPTAAQPPAGCLDGSAVPATALGKLQLASGLLAQVQAFLKSPGAAK